MKKIEIENVLKHLIGNPICEMGRAADLLWIHFGKMEKIPENTDNNKLESNKTVGDWAIHVQCPWRITCKGNIILSWRDFHFDADNKTNYDWNKGGESRFDIIVKRLNQKIEHKNLKVITVAADNIGGFSIVLESNYTFDVFPDNSIKDNYSEYWRIFQPKLDKKHFIIA